MSNYEAAPATQILATHCACCARPLLDSVSVETGIGPDCRKKYLGAKLGVTESARIEANTLVNRIAKAITGSHHDRQAVAQVLAGEQIAKLRSMGFAKLADKLTAAWIKISIEETGDSIVVKAPYSEEAVNAQRSIPGRRWDGERKCNSFPASQKPAVWSMLRRFYGGMAGMGPKGAFVIQ